MSKNKFYEGDSVMTVLGCEGTIENIDSDKRDRRYLVRFSSYNETKFGLRSDLMALNEWEISL